MRTRRSCSQWVSRKTRRCQAVRPHPQCRRGHLAWNKDNCRHKVPGLGKCLWAANWRRGAGLCQWHHGFVPGKSGIHVIQSVCRRQLDRLRGATASKLVQVHVHKCLRHQRWQRSERHECCLLNNSCADHAGPSLNAQQHGHQHRWRRIGFRRSKPDPNHRSQHLRGHCLHRALRRRNVLRHQSRQGHLLGRNKHRLRRCRRRYGGPRLCHQTHNIPSRRNQGLCNSRLRNPHRKQQAQTSLLGPQSVRRSRRRACHGCEPVLHRLAGRIAHFPQRRDRALSLCWRHKRRTPAHMRALCARF
eukprot:comp22447_c0_seq1/m.55163 comp22447_c0_seq1/g.55163  ORF comp22447_c0_seq1/g.55163 comp22447_c0_seq1/m.55163 type:complete len:302 (-) comp22447_c0_seq1:4387-5292(-)